ncbi:Xaa-Pro peptidase family protein [Roseomonas sp. OT10]|uniref:M24 family metallopeptidase n=1 Tax=Roseomonas cutis TaxID=2897332 RepID=UPI001E46476E|nr:Xaa-Pro peptidase family protein [Roseomonas sp. OT10]UFN47277.1 Xaa-Pro peptidase family protein [Roseomonas sp. OT10]
MTPLLPFAAAEFEGRRAATLALMAQRGLDALILTSSENIYYLTGFGSLAYAGTALLLGADGTGVWVIRRTELSNIRALNAELWAKEGVGVADGQEFGTVLRDTLRERFPAARRIGIELGSVKASLASFLGITETGFACENVSGLVESLRRVKSPAEIALLRRAGHIVATACREGYEALRPGMTDSELAAVVTAALIRHGSDRIAQMPNVCAGPRTARAHVTWCGETILPGEVVNVEPAASVRDYTTPVYRMASLGEPPEEARRMFAVCREALDAGYAAVRPGMTSHEAARVFETVIEKAGYAEYMVTRPAYSIGGSFPPGWGEDDVAAIRRNSDMVLEAGMCFHVVPCLYKDGLGCIAASMPSELTAEGFRPLADDTVEWGVR